MSESSSGNSPRRVRVSTGKGFGRALEKGPGMYQRRVWVGTGE